jgi:putative colanic acid biosynthesis acetyltransferase WcaF
MVFGFALKTILTLEVITIHSHAVLSINSLASKDLDPYSIYSGNPSVYIKKRIIR